MKIVQWVDWYFNADLIRLVKPLDREVGCSVWMVGSKSPSYLKGITTERFMAEVQKQLQPDMVTRAFYDASVAERKELQATVEAMRLEATAQQSEVRALRDQLALCQAELAAHTHK